MHLLWHIFKKDFRHLRGLVAVYWALLLAQVMLPLWMYGHEMYNVPHERQGYYGFRPVADDADGHQMTLYFFTNAEKFLYWAGAFVIAVLAARVVRGDPPNNERAQWRTQPVGRPMILGAKTLFLLLVAAVPAAVAGMGAKMYLGFPTTDWLTGSGTAMVVAMLWAMPAVLATILFENMALRTLFLLGLVGIGVMMVVGAQIPPDLTMEPRIVEGVYLLCLLGGIINVLRYLCLGNGTAVVMLGVGLGLICLTLGSIIPEPVPPSARKGLYNFENQPYASPSRNALAAETELPAIPLQQAPYPKIEMNNGTVVNYNSSWERNGAIVRFYEINGVFLHEPDFVPKEEALFVSSVDDGSGAKTISPIRSASQETDGYTLRSELIYVHASGWPLNLDGVVRATGLGKPVNDPQTLIPGTTTINLFELEESEKIHLDYPRKITGAVHFRSGPLARVVDVPLQIGATTNFGSTILQIEDIHLQSNVRPGAGLPGNDNQMRSCEAIVEFSRRQPTLSPWPSLNWPLPQPRSETQDFFFLWNPQRKEYFVLNSPPNHVGNWWTSVFDVNFTVEEYEFGAMVSAEYHGRKFLLRDEKEAAAWLKDARLVVLEFTPKHYYRAPFTIDPFVPPGQAEALQPPPTP